MCFVPDYTTKTSKISRYSGSKKNEGKCSHFFPLHCFHNGLKLCYLVYTLQQVIMLLCPIKKLFVLYNNWIIRHTLSTLISGCSSHRWWEESKGRWSSPLRSSSTLMFPLFPKPLGFILLKPVIDFLACWLIRFKKTWSTFQICTSGLTFSWLLELKHRVTPFFSADQYLSPYLSPYFVTFTTCFFFIFIFRGSTITWQTHEDLGCCEESGNRLLTVDCRDSVARKV